MNKCFSDDLLSLEVAQEKILNEVTISCDIVCIPISKALGRVLSNDIVAPINVPPFDTSAMDGYAVNHEDVPDPGTSLPLTQTISAGSEASPLALGSTARILTGAPIPIDADTVIIQENCTARADAITFNKIPYSGANIRKQGCHIQKNQKVLPKGHKLQAVDLSLLASLGISEINVYKPLRIGILSTGSELVEPGQPLAPGQIYNSNHILLSNLITSLGYELIDLGCIADDLAITRTTIQNAQNTCDIIISSGGVSVGDKDYIKPVLEEMGTIEFWKLKIKPGKPITFGKVENTFFMGLPGNPVSCFVTFCLLCSPLISRAQGIEDIFPKAFKAKAGFTQLKPDRRKEFQRAFLQSNDLGELVATPYKNQDSATLLSIQKTEGLVEIPDGTSVMEGDILNFYPYTELLK